jgi:hypothetical protein
LTVCENKNFSRTKNIFKKKHEVSSDLEHRGAAASTRLWWKRASVNDGGEKKEEDCQEQKWWLQYYPLYCAFGREAKINRSVGT